MSAVTIVIATTAKTAIRDSRTGRLCRCCTGMRRVRTMISSSPPTAKRELYSSTKGWPSRPSASAYERRKPLTYVGAGRMSNCSSSSARRYLGRIFVRSSSAAKSSSWRILASRRLEPMSNTRGIVDGLPETALSRAVLVAGRRTRAGRRPRARRARSSRGRARDPQHPPHARAREIAPSSRSVSTRRARLANESAASASPAATGIAKATCRSSYASLKRVA